MDIARTPPPKKKRLVIGGVIAVGVVAATAALASLGPQAPSVDRATLIIDTVRRGTMVRDVRAFGTLVPEHVRIIAAVTAGRVEQLPVRPGTAVQASTVIVKLTN